MNYGNEVKTYVRLANDGYEYYPQVVEEFDDPEFCIEPMITVIECGPAMGNAMLPANVQASRWAAERGIPYC